MIAFQVLRDFLARNSSRRRRMRERPNEAVLNELAVLLQVYDESIAERRKESGVDEQ